MRPERKILLLAAAALVTGCPGDDFTQVRVMTQNLAIGIRLEPVLLAPDLASLPPLVDVAWAEKDDSDFALRAARIADAIQASGADVVGLQEVIQLFEGPLDGPPTPTCPQCLASTPAKDFLELLLAELATRNLDFAVVTDGTDQGIVSNANVELSGTAADYRVVDREAVIARSNVQILDVRTGNYAEHLQLMIGGTVPFAYERGWVAVDAVKDGRAFTFVSTHLEPFDPRVQSGQATELLALLDSGSPTVVVGDMNSAPNDAAWPAYGMLVSPTTGLWDAGADAGAVDATCCRDALCAEPDDELEKRVDLVLHSPHFQTAWVSAWGAADADYSTTTSLWPADHAGVSAVLEIE
jgi:endonuclease/exonuclease/phosphatase family metal-dependent hydrolase